MEFELPEELAEVQNSPTIPSRRKSRRMPRKMTENIAFTRLDRQNGRARFLRLLDSRGQMFREHSEAHHRARCAGLPKANR